MSHSFQINSVFHDSDIYLGASSKVKIMFLRFITTLVFQHFSEAFHVPLGINSKTVRWKWVLGIVLTP